MPHYDWIIANSLSAGRHKAVFYVLGQIEDTAGSCLQLAQWLCRECSAAKIHAMAVEVHIRLEGITCRQVLIDHLVAKGCQVTDLTVS